MGEEQEERQQTSQGGSVARDVAQEKVKQEIKKKAAKKAAETTAQVAGKSSLLAALGPILIWVLIIVVAIIIIVGIIMFFMTVPGMVMEKLKDFASDFADAICSWFGADSTKQIEEQEVYDVLNYLEQMGYDLKGYGFLSQNADENDANYDERVGVIRDPETGLIKDLDEGQWFGGKQEAYSDIINLYIMSDNYVYTVRNFNNVSTWWTGFKWLQAIGHHIGDLFGTDNTKWGKGLLSLYKENGGEIGKEGDSYQNGIFGWNSIEVDASSKKMKIRKGWGNKAFEYNLDGWTGRYGMPLDFLISLHIATMKPDLTYEMVTTFDTEVKILLRTISEGSISASYKNPSGRYVTYAEVEEAIHGSKSDDVVNSIINWFDDNWGGLTEEEVEVLNNMGFGDDKDIIKEILSELKATNAYSFETFVPYLSRVSNHWFRDVYFILSEDEVQNTLLSRTDIDYEKFVNERWSLYETYTEGDKKGEYKLYKYDASKDYGIGELYDGTQAEADAEGIKVVKKQIKTTASDMASESYEANPNDPETEVGAIIKLNDDGSWSAYESKDTESEEYERVYPDEDESTIKGKIYYKVKFANNAVQKEDGLRGVTNQTIKDMFLNRNYFNYNGSTETADIIEKARNQLDMDYGSIPDDKLDIEIADTVNPDDDEPYQIKDLVSNVSITQDSMGAFSMLENTHTLDADYIYRDFKELIVELGYFTKEELSEGTPKLLQWLIPDIGSGGYPKRVLDKKENELGTLAHSKQDYEANEKDTLASLYEKISQMKKEPQIEGNVPETKKVSGISSNNNSQKLSEVSGINSNSNMESDNVLSSKNSNVNLKTVKGTGASFVLERVDEAGDGYASVLESGNVKYLHRYQGGQSYSGVEFFWAGGSRTLGQAACGLFACFNVLTGYGYDFQPAKELAGYQWPATMDAVKNLMEEKGVTGQFVDYTDTAAVDEALNEGRPAILLFQSTIDKQGVSWTSGGHFVALAGKDKSGNIVTLDSAAQGNVKRHDYPGTVEDMLPAFQSAPIWIADEPPTGMKKEGEPYEGYLGDEAVVSPVTGILLDYGTYDEDDVDPETGEEYRKNVDVMDQTDKVGYAKILVLNEEIADQIVTCENHSKDTDDKKGIKGKITVSTPEEVKTYKTWSEEEKALYGYKLFKDDYEKGGIAGYLLYIDGFKCELPNTETEDEEKDREEIVWDENYEAGSDTTLTMEYFKEKAAKGTGNSFNECKYEETLYESDDVYKLLSEKLEKKQEARAEGKSMAAPLYSFKGTLDGEQKDMILIKEGTVLGRTFTDKEIVEVNGGTYVKPEKPKEGEEDTREVHGNYLRIIMRDLDDTVVENVEDYMKLDDLETQAGDQEYQFREGDLEILADAICHEGCGSYCAGYLNTNSEEDKLYLSKSTGYTIINKLNTDSGFSPDYNNSSNLWDSSKSPLYNLLCRIPNGSSYQQKAQQYGFTTGLKDGWYAIAPDLRHRIETNDLEYCDTCFEAAEYIKENDSMNFKNNGKFGAQYSAGEGMPHTMWEQGGNYYGEHKIWFWIDKNKNGQKDIPETDYYLFDTEE